jgi:hypothetical protein
LVVGVRDRDNDIGLQSHAWSREHLGAGLVGRLPIDACLAPLLGLASGEQLYFVLGYLQP